MRTGIILRYAAAIAVLLAGCLTARSVDAQEAEEDAAPISASTQLPPDHSPRGALWRAAAVPGWGQLYNRQVYKAPIVWGGLAGIIGSALYINHRYLLYRHAFFWIERENPNVTISVPPAWESDYLTLIRDLGLSEEDAAGRQGQLSGLFKQNRDILRRNRDLLYIGVGLFYGLSILDAYVSAHLLDFDVSEDLTLSLQPMPRGFAARMRLTR